MTALHVEGARLYFGAASALLSEVVRRAAEGLADAHLAALKAGAKLMPHPGWGPLLAADAVLQAALEGADPGGAVAGRAILDAVRRAAEPGRSPDDIAAAVTAAARAAAEHVAGSRRGVRLAAYGPVAVEVRSEAPPDAVRLLWAERACPASLKGRKRAEWISRHMAGTTSAVRAIAHLSGGPFGRRLVLQIGGSSVLEWAAATWALAVAPLERSPPALRPPASSAAGADPIVVLRGGAPVAAGLLDRDVLADLAADDAPPPIEPATVDAFIAEQTLERDEGQRLDGEEEDLEAVARGEHGERTLSAEDCALAGRLARELAAGKATDPRLRAAREAVRASAVGSRRRASGADVRAWWAREIARIAAAARDAQADADDAAVLAALESAPPPACAILLQPGYAPSADPWLDAVAHAAARAELDALRARVVRPKARERVAAVLASLPPAPAPKPLRAACAAVRYAAAGICAAACASEADALDAARGALAALGPGECAVAAREHTSDLGPSGPWLVLRGTLAALLEVGLERLRLDAGAVRGSIAVHDGASAAEVLESALGWAVAEWAARGCEGEPPPMVDAVRAACAALPRRT